MSIPDVSLHFLSLKGGSTDYCTLQSIVPQKGGEVNLTLGGIDLNNSGSVVMKADKKLLTVLFPDGGDGRAFTLKVISLSLSQNFI
ncbi:Rho GTPase-activating protein 7 [Vitis vinifera]|uniref:Rho GTPase-activating protein 7 n=1 Tax=Vitis vinifera TaxID=29760 RepID=A0A438KRR9_VITVI|nr:Rho GTPase-activating protein 7 [Vitis vinifera]